MGTDISPTTDDMVRAGGFPAVEHQGSPRVVPPLSVAPPEGGLQDGDNYLLRSLSDEDATMLWNVRGRCKSFRASHQWLSYVTEGRVPHFPTVDVRGLVNVVPCNGPGDKANDYYISGFAIDNYTSLLATGVPVIVSRSTSRQQQPHNCRQIMQLCLP